MINSLQAGRYFASIAVVLHHANQSVSAFVGARPAILQMTLHYGYLGVNFFFVLSGFIIHYSMNMLPRTALEFAYDRSTRIMLPYWPVGIGLALAYTLYPELSGSDRNWSWLSTLN